MVYRCDRQYVLASHVFCVRKTRFLCSQNTFFVFAKHVFCVRNSHQNVREHSKPQTLCAVLFAGEYVKHGRKKQSKTETQER